MLRKRFLAEEGREKPKPKPMGDGIFVSMRGKAVVSRAALRRADFLFLQVVEECGFFFLRANGNKPVNGSAFPIGSHFRSDGIGHATATPPRSVPDSTSANMLAFAFVWFEVRRRSSTPLLLTNMCPR